MADAHDAARKVQLDIIARIIAPAAFRQRDTGKGGPAVQHQVTAALAKAEAIQAAQDLQLSFGRHTAKPSWPPTEDARQLLMAAAEASGQAIHAATELERVREDRTLSEALTAHGWPRLQPAQRLDVEAHVRGLTVDRETYDAPRQGWTCFHCGERFYTEAGARLHFGAQPVAPPICADVSAAALAVTEDASPNSDGALRQGDAAVSGHLVLALRHALSRTNPEHAAMAEAPERYVYLEDFTDEVMPCKPTLEAWAAWLAEPDSSWNRPEAAADGAEFAAYTLDVLGDRQADLVDGVWQLATPAPEGTQTYYLRHHEGSQGWDAEHAGDTLADALDSMWGDETRVWVACVKFGPKLRVRFEAAGPRCVILGEVQ